MSNRAITWAYRQRTGSAARKAVLVALADQANSDGVCWPGQKSLAEDLELSERSVRRALGDLVVTGFVTVEHRRWEDSQKQRTNYYHLNLEREDTVTAGAGGQSDRGPEDTVSGEREDTVTAEEPSALNPLPEPSSSSLSTEPVGGRLASDDDERPQETLNRVERALMDYRDLSAQDQIHALDVLWPRLKAGEHFTSPVSYALTCAREHRATRLAAEKSQQPKRLELDDGSAIVIHPNGHREIEEATG